MVHQTYHPDRRRFICQLGESVGYITALGIPASVLAQPAVRQPARPHTITAISGKPFERGRSYGDTFKDSINHFLEREVFKPFVSAKHPTRDQLLRYANACSSLIKSYSPEIMEEIEGMAQGSGLRVEELVLLSLHEELWHRGVLPSTEHCTAVALGPRTGAVGDTWVGQTWDWMESVYGLSTMLHWQRPTGPSLLAYAYPGLWVGAGLNSAGIALVWTSAGSGSPGVGIPSYVLIAQMLYQSTLRAALDEARRARNAGYFTFVLGDAEGRLVNVEGRPGKIVVEESRELLIRHNYGSREMTGTPAGRAVQPNGRCSRVFKTYEANRLRRSEETLKAIFADREVGRSALDVMLFNTTKREAILSRGPGDLGRWKKFSFADSRQF